MIKEEGQSYYRSTLPDIVESLKDMVENNLEIVGRDISPMLPDDKIKLALESRRTASEDVIWACREIDRMELTLQGVEEEDQDGYVGETYFRRIIPRLIKELKGMIENNLRIVGKTVPESITDDKLKRAIVSRRVGAEDSVWASKQVDELEKILTGKGNEEEEEEIKSWAKRKARS